MSTAMERYVEQPLDLIQNIDDLARLSKQVADSKYYLKTDNAAQASVKLMIARELGLGLTSLPTIHLVEGKIQLGYQLMIALVKRSGKYDLRFRERTDEIVRIEWFERGDDGKLESVGFSKFDMADATRAGINRGNYGKYPVRMLTARAVSDGFNAYAPECAGGAIYSEGEFGDTDSTPAAPSSRAPRARRESTPTESSEETIVEAEVVLDDAPGVVATPAESNPDDSDKHDGEGDAASSSTNTIAAMLKSMTAPQRKAVREACEALGIVWDSKVPTSLLERFGSDAESVKTLLPALSAAVNPPALVEGEVEPPFGEDPAVAAADVEAAQRFQEWNNEQDARRAEASERIGAAGSYGK